jgi:hypothetical protein
MSHKRFGSQMDRATCKNSGHEDHAESASHAHRGDNRESLLGLHVKEGDMHERLVPRQILSARRESIADKQSSTPVARKLKSFSILDRATHTRQSA